MIVIGFVSFAVSIILSFGIFYSSSIQDRIRLNQVENFAFQVVSSAETVFFSGEPSKSTLRISLPSGVRSIQVIDDGLLVNVFVSSGENVRLFESRVPLSGQILNVKEGVKVITITAQTNSVNIDG